MLHPGVTKFREEYVIPTATEEGELHLGLGFTIKTDDANGDQRTLNNGCNQFWSIITVLTINKLHKLIDEAGLQDDIKVSSTIYDSIYFQVRKDPEIVEWLNNNVVPILTKDLVYDQVVPNTAALEVGNNWNDLLDVPISATIPEIAALLDQL